MFFFKCEINKNFDDIFYLSLNFLDSCYDIFVKDPTLHKIAIHRI